MKNEHGIPAKIKEIGFQNCYISELTILEIMYGVANSASSKKEANYLRLKDLELDFDNRILPIRNTFNSFSEEKTRLRQAGTLISDFDLLIGCTALTHNLILATRNTKELSRLTNLVIEDWIIVS